MIFALRKAKINIEFWFSFGECENHPLKLMSNFNQVLYLMKNEKSRWGCTTKSIGMILESLDCSLIPLRGRGNNNFRTVIMRLIILQDSFSFLEGNDISNGVELAQQKYIARQLYIHEEKNIIFQNTFVFVRINWCLITVASYKVRKIMIHVHSNILPKN